MPPGASVPHTGRLRGAALSCRVLVGRGQAPNGNANVSWQMHQHPGVRGWCAPTLLANSQPTAFTQTTVTRCLLSGSGCPRPGRARFIHTPPCASRQSTGFIRGATPCTYLPKVSPRPRNNHNRKTEETSRCYAPSPLGMSPHLITLWQVGIPIAPVSQMMKLRQRA